MYPSGGYTRYVYNYTSYLHMLTVPPGFQFYGTDNELTAKYVCSQQSSTYTPGSTTAGTGNTCAATEDETTYSPTVASSQYNHSANTVTDPVGNQTLYQFNNYSEPIAYTQETSRKEYQGSSTSGTLLRTVDTSYGVPRALFPRRRPRSCPTDCRSRLTGPMRQGSRNPTKTLEYDWGSGTPGPLLRETDVVYPTSTTGCWWRPTSKTVKNGSGTQIALTTYELDNYTAGITASDAVQHDSNFNTSLTNRCNITAIEEWRNTDGATLTTRMQYDDAGNVLSSTDPLGHVTTTSYADSWGNSTCEPSGGNAAAYPTSITTGSLTTTREYNSCSGNVAKTTDPNTQPTSYTYDLMGRTTLTSFPDGGSLTNCFSEMSGSCNSTTYPIDVVSTQAITSSTNKKTTTLLDGIARVTESQVNNFPGCSSTMMKVDTVYDADGRKSSVSNPYCTTTDSTYGLTKYAYDGLSRVTTLTHPDTTTITTAYDYLVSYTNGSTTAYQNCSIGTDENGNQHEKCDNGVGQMTAVLEPNGTTQTPTMETDYCYDMLNDMTLVMQSGGSRGTFTCTGGAGTAPSGARVFALFYVQLALRTADIRQPRIGTINIHVRQ